MRRAKFDSPQLWHVFSRGPRRLGLFEKDGDYLVFLSLLAQAVTASGAVLIGYTLMTNHYHLMLLATSAQRTSCMRRLNYLYAKYYNAEHALSGHAFEAPYKAYVQRSLVLALYKLAYIFLNPVRAHLCGACGDYRWSCAGSYLGGDPGPLPVDVGPLFALMKLPTAEARARFAEIVRREKARPSRKSGQAFTSLELYRQQFEWLLELADEKRELLEGEAPEHVATLWARSVGIPPRALLDPGSGRSAHSLSQAISQFRAKLAEKGKLQRILDLLAGP